MVLEMSLQEVEKEYQEEEIKSLFPVRLVVAGRNRKDVLLLERMLEGEEWRLEGGGLVIQQSCWEIDPEAPPLQGYNTI